MTSTPLKPVPEEKPLRHREPTQFRDWPFRVSLVPGRGWVRNLPTKGHK